MEARLRVYTGVLGVNAGVMLLLIHSHGLEIEGFVVNKRMYCLGSIDGRELILEKQATPSLNPVLFI